MDTSILPEILQPYLPYLVQVAYAIFIFVVGWIVSKWTQRLILRMLRIREIDEALSRFLAAIAQYLVLAATVIVALGEVGVETTSLVALLASAGLAVGLALQGSLANFAAGVMILFFRPFTLGDKITAAGHTAKVDDIGLFATIMLTADNEQVIVPNSAITADSIVNHTVRGTLRGNIAVGLAYSGLWYRDQQSHRGDVKAARRVDLVLEDPVPEVAFSGFGASALDFVVRPRATSGNYLDMLHNVRFALYDDLNAAGIEIPFDQIVIHSAA